MKHTIYSRKLVDSTVSELGIPRLENATIGEVVLLARRLEELTGISFIRMDQGVPGLEPCRVVTSPTACWSLAVRKELADCMV